MPVLRAITRRDHGRRNGRDRAGAASLDDVSKSIIEQLQQDGRRSYAAIGKVVGLSEAAVRQRVQRLIDSGVMQVVAVTDPLAARLRAARRWSASRSTARSSPSPTRSPALDEVDYVVITAGTYDLLVEVVCESDEHLLELLSEPGSGPSRASCPPRRSCTSSCASRPTRGACAEP